MTKILTASVYSSTVYYDNAMHLLGLKCPFCSAVTVLFLVLPRVEQLPFATQAAADRHSSSEQPGGALPPAELLDPWEVQVSSLPYEVTTSFQYPRPHLLHAGELIFFCAATWRAFWKSLQTLPKRTRSRSSMTCWDHTCSGGWRLMFSNTCHQRRSSLWEWSSAPCRSNITESIPSSWTNKIYFSLKYILILFLFLWA